MTTSRRPNRGPSAAQANRRAIVAAAQEVFAEGGIDAPLAEVAKRACVGQGSLYRHFPDRASLAVAVFETNAADLEALAATGAGLNDLLALITAQTVASIAFANVATNASDPRLAALLERVKAVVSEPLHQAKEEGTVQSSLSIQDLMLAISMVAGYLARVPASARRDAADGAWALLRRGLKG